MSDLERWRDEFPILSRSVYMISNSLGAMPRQTALNLAEYAETWATRGVRGWEERWWEMPAEVGNEIARVIGAPAGTVSMHENVTTAHLGGHHSRGSRDAGRRLRRRRLPEVAVRRSRQRVSLQRPDLLAHARPSFTGWLSRTHPFDFDIAGSDRDFVADGTATGDARTSRSDPAVRTDAMHMMNGTPSIPAYYAALAGLDIINAVGVERIRAASQQMTARLLALVDQYGFSSAASRDPERLAGTVAVSVPDAPLVSRTLKARDFIVDYRPPVGIRISPHFYNTMDEIDRVMAEIASITETRDYADGGSSSLVT